MADPAYGGLPFAQAIAFFRGKLNLPTRAWTDVWQDGHDTAFMVAGAYKAELLADFRAAVDRAIADGGTLAQFRAEFDTIVERHGWSYQGGRGWRTRVIYDTNLRTAYQAGRFAQLTDPDLLKSRPYWRYRHSDLVETPRPQHLAWDGLVLRHDDPFWAEHFPPNGWGCRCSVVAESERTLRRRGKHGPDPAPPVERETRTVGVRGPTPRTVSVPTGIDPGFAYTPGRSVAPQIRQQLEAKVTTLLPPLGEALLRDLTDIPAAPPAEPRTLDEWLAAGRSAAEELAADLPDAAAEPLAWGAAYRARLTERLRQVRPIDTPARVASRGQGAAMVREASQRFPDTWTQAADALGVVHVVTRGHRGRHRRVGGDSEITVPSARGAVAEFARATALHEYVHRLQGALPELDGFFQELHRRRTAGDPLRRLRALQPSYRPDEVTREDRYLDPYFGKEYGPRGALEMMTMTYQYLLADSPAKVAELYRHDRELLDLAIGLLFHYKL